MDSDRLDFMNENPNAVWRSKGHRGHGDSWSCRDIHGNATDWDDIRSAIDYAMRTKRDLATAIAGAAGEKDCG